MMAQYGNLNKHTEAIFSGQNVLCRESGTAFMNGRHKFYELFRHKNLEKIVKYNLLKAR